MLDVVCCELWLDVICCELVLYVVADCGLVYLFTVMFSFACWSILGVDASRILVTFRSHV